jgi:hypothetical protein
MKTYGVMEEKLHFLSSGHKREMSSHLNARFFYPGGYIPRYSLDRSLGGPQTRSGRCGIEKNLLALAENRNYAVHTIRYTDCTI